MSEDTFGGADEVITVLSMSGQGDDDGSGVGQRTLLGHGCPPNDPGALEVKEEEDAAKEALDASTFTQVSTGPGGWEARAALSAFGVPRNDGGGAEGGVNPGDQGETSLGSIKADNAGTAIVEGDDGGKEGLGKGGIMTVRRCDAEEGRQTGPRQSTVWTRKPRSRAVA